MAGKPVGHAPARVGIPVADSSILINNGDGKHNEDGPVTVALATGTFVAPRGIVRTNLAAPQYPYSTSAKSGRTKVNTRCAQA